MPGLMIGNRGGSPSSGTTNVQRGELPSVIGCGVDRTTSPITSFAFAIAIAAAIATSTDASAQPRRGKIADKGGAKGKDSGKKSGGSSGKTKPPPTLDFSGIQFQGELRTPQLLYFLDRASEELERASLETRSFIPEMVKSVDEDDL